MMLRLGGEGFEASELRVAQPHGSMIFSEFSEPMISLIFPEKNQKEICKVYQHSKDIHYLGIYIRIKPPSQQTGQ